MSNAVMMPRLTARANRLNCKIGDRYIHSVMEPERQAKLGVKLSNVFILLAEKEDRGKAVDMVEMSRNQLHKYLKYRRRIRDAEKDEAETK